VDINEVYVILHQQLSVRQGKVHCRYELIMKQAGLTVALLCKLSLLVYPLSSFML